MAVSNWIAVLESKARASLGFGWTKQYGMLKKKNFAQRLPSKLAT